MAPEPNDGRSFTERYRGTEWDSAPVVGPVIGPRAAHHTQAQRGGPSILLLAGVGMLVAVVAVIGVLLYTDSERPVLLPAAVLPISSPLASPPAATAPPPVAISPSPAPSVPASVPPAAATPVASASATPTAPPLVLPDDPAAAFAVRMLRGDATYTVETEGQFAVGNDRLAWNSTMDVAGRDLSGSMRISQQRVRVLTDIIVKDDVQYTRLAGEEWIREEGVPQGMPMALFLTTNPSGSYSGLEYVKAVKRDGRQLHHLRMPQSFVPGLTDEMIAGYEGGLSVRSLTLDLWVTGDGKPAAANLTFDATARAAGVEVDMTIEMAYRFTRWGDDIVIEAPEQFTDPGYTDG